MHKDLQTPAKRLAKKKRGTTKRNVFFYLRIGSTELFNIGVR